MRARDRIAANPAAACSTPSWPHVPCTGRHYAGLAPEFAYPSALGDLLAAVLALIAIPAVAAQARFAKPLVWLFNIWGSLDLLAAIVLATRYDANVHMGPAYWIPAFWVPGLLVTHYIVFLVLLTRWTRPQNSLQASETVESSGSSS